MQISGLRCAMRSAASDAPLRPAQFTYGQHRRGCVCVRRRLGAGRLLILRRRIGCEALKHAKPAREKEQRHPATVVHRQAAAGCESFASEQCFGAPRSAHADRAPVSMPAAPLASGRRCCRLGLMPYRAAALLVDRTTKRQARRCRSAATRRAGDSAPGHRPANASATMGDGRRRTPLHFGRQPSTCRAPAVTSFGSRDRLISSLASDSA